MPLIDPRVARHLETFVPARPPELRAMEARAEETNFPIIGPASGQFCYLVARMIEARRVFELGSGFGYSTAWFARAVRENGGGRVHHVVWDAGLSREARESLAALGYDDIVEYTVGEAITALGAAEGQFDLIFNDIDKQHYPQALDVVERKLRPGGVLITDNVLWHGRIFDERDRSDATRGVREFTRRITESDSWIPSIVPIRDGLMVAVRAEPGS